MRKRSRFRAASWNCRIEERIPDRKTPVIVQCASGTRSILAARTLRELGYENVYNMTGGFSAWKDRGLPWVADRAFTAAELTRYSRHFVIPEVGEKGQAKLLDAKVLLLGAGALGSPAALYLAAAGVGTIGLVDFDVVDLSNLQRQIIHTTDRAGMPKTESAQKQINALNPGVKVIRHDLRLTSENAMDIIKDYDVIVNCGDNFPTRYLINDACVLSKKPLVDGAIFRFEGNATVFYPAKGGPCYRCLYPEPAPPGMAPSCAEAGVLGALPGLIGSIEALEAIKLIIGAGSPLIGKMVYFDTLSDKDYVRSSEDPQGSEVPRLQRASHARPRLSITKLSAAWARLPTAPRMRNQPRIRARHRRRGNDRTRCQHSRKSGLIAAGAHARGSAVFFGG